MAPNLLLLDVEIRETGDDYRCLCSWDRLTWSNSYDFTIRIQDMQFYFLFQSYPVTTCFIIWNLQKGNINMYGYGIILGLVGKLTNIKPGPNSFQGAMAAFKRADTKSDAELTISYERRDHRGFRG